MDTFHDRMPDGQMPGTVAFHGFIIIVTTPDTCSIVRSEAYKPAVCIIICRTGLSGCRHIAQACAVSCTAADYILHRACKKISGGVLDSFVRRRSRIIDQNISVVVEDFCIEDRFCICPAVCDRRKRRCKLNIVYTIGDTSESHCLRNICICKGCESEFLQIFVSCLRSDVLSECADRNGIDRVPDRIADGCSSFITFVRVVHFLSAFVFIWFVYDCICQRDLSFVQSRRVSRQNLETGTRLLRIICRTVEGTIT